MGVRLGYACINLSLQQKTDGPRLKALTAKRLVTLDEKERRAELYRVGRNNLKAVEAALRWNAEHGVMLYRITSELIPLATHPVAAFWDWEADLAYEFNEVAAAARATGCRITSHPGQYTVLNARDPEIVAKAVEDLVYHARCLELLGGAPDWGMVLHVGGGYGDKAAAQERFVANFRALPQNVAGRLWIENDDTTWDTAEALAVAEAVGRPMVFDVHHHRCLREDDWLPWLERILPTWGAVRPKLHYSTPKDGKRSRSHADGIDPVAFAEFLRRTEGRDLDVMLECKLKDQAVLQLRADLEAEGLADRLEPAVAVTR